MSVRRKAMPTNVTPPDDFIIRQRHELRIAALHAPQHEIAGLRQRARFKKSEIFALAGDNVERAVKALNVLRPNWLNLCVHASGRSDVFLVGVTAALKMPLGAAGRKL